MICGNEYASRLVEKGVPLAQVRDLLGHASITTTERYDNQTFAALQAAAQRLESGKTFTNPSQTAHGSNHDDEPPKPSNPRKSLRRRGCPGLAGRQGFEFGERPFSKWLMALDFWF
ncbi:MAG: tyrosine-type recombinase/integrase [Vicinamibacterales bacterium]